MLQPTFIQQVILQKLQYDKEELRHLQRQREAVYLLEIKNLISEKVATSALKKIVGKVIAHVAKTNELKRITSNKLK